MTALKQFLPNLYLTELSLPEFDVRGAVIVSGDDALVWDTLSCPSDMRCLDALLANKNVHVVYSHADWDHCWGTAALTPCSITAHDECLKRFSSDVPAELAKFKESDNQKYSEVKLLPPTQTFKTSMTVELDGLAVELHYLPGHTLDCIVAYIPVWGILLAGDTLEEPLPVINDAKLVSSWCQKLKEWQAYPNLKQIIPSHGPISDSSLIQRNLDYFNMARRGESLPDAEKLSQFYAETHQANCLLLAKN